MEYRQDILKQLQNVELSMLKLFDSVCSKYNIKYFLIFGTAIGAMRHNGFIPWDDDIDVAVFRDDLDKLRNVPREEWKDNLLVFPDDGTPFHRLCFPRLYKKGTKFSDVDNWKLIKSKDKNNNHITPIWIDVQVYDRIDAPEQIERIAREKIRYRSLYRVAKSDLKIDAKKGFKSIVRNVFRKMIFIGLNLRKNPELHYYTMYCCASKNVGKYVTNFDTMTYKEMFTSCCKYQEMFPLKRVKFESIVVNVPNNIDSILTSIYGDYMQLPPVEKRVNHSPAILDFGDGINVVGK